jgi:hypothetical protein
VAPAGAGSAGADSDEGGSSTMQIPKWEVAFTPVFWPGNSEVQLAFFFIVVSGLVSELSPGYRSDRSQGVPSIYQK